jgi:hypothetical protein
VRGGQDPLVGSGVEVASASGAAGGVGTFPSFGGFGAVPSFGGVGAVPSFGGSGAFPSFGGVGAVPSFGGVGAFPSASGPATQPGAVPVSPFPAGPAAGPSVGAPVGAPLGAPDGVPVADALAVAGAATAALTPIPPRTSTAAAADPIPTARRVRRRFVPCSFSMVFSCSSVGRPGRSADEDDARVRI